MKPNSWGLKALFLFLVLLSTSAIAQTNHVITLRVNTSQITKSTVNQYANFGQSNGVSNENYAIEVRVGDYVEWEGISTTSDDVEVEILSINHQGGARVFGRNVLNGSNGIVIAQVTEGRAGDYEKYTIKFRISGSNQVFIIDPKIIIKG